MRFPDLRELLSPLDWATVGAAATRQYMPERATDDLDILVADEDAAAVRGRLEQAGFAYLGPLTIGGGQWESPDGFAVDVLASAEPWVRPALVEARGNRDPQELPVLPLPYLVLMKYRASRLQDIADVGRMLGQATEEQLAAVRSVFARWQPDGQEDLESLIILGRLELERPDAG